MKKLLLIFVVGIIAVMGFKYYGDELGRKKAEQDRINRSAVAFERYLGSVNIRKNFLDFFLKQEELKIKKAKEEEMKEYVRKNTKYAKVNNIDVLSEGFEKTGLNFNRGQSLIVVDQKEFENNEYSLVKFKYDEEPKGWVSNEYLTDNRKELIDIVYDNVEYDFVEKTSGYANNPMIKVRGIYVTGYKAAESLDKLIELSKRTEINAFVIDFKDDNENMLFFSEAAAKNSPKANDKVYIKKPEEFMQKLKDNNIYAIARIVTFKSPRYAIANPEKSIIYKSTGQIFKTRDGISWSSPYDRDLWKYNVDIAKEAAAYGFNEIQFDYVRFPATGSKKDESLDFRNFKNENKTQAIQNFLKYAYAELSAKNVYVAADIFGWTATAINDVGIGQHWEALAGVVDYMCPMMYPSHYGPGIFGLAVPDARPYETIDQSIKDAIKRNGNIEWAGKLRPWIQDFTASWVDGYIRYGEKEVAAQIKALKDNGIDEYIIWNPMNRYSEGALKGGNNE